MTRNRQIAMIVGAGVGTVLAVGIVQMPKYQEQRRVNEQIKTALAQISANQTVNHGAVRTHAQSSIEPAPMLDWEANAVPRAQESVASPVPRGTVLRGEAVNHDRPSKKRSTRVKSTRPTEPIETSSVGVVPEKAKTRLYGNIKVTVLDDSLNGPERVGCAFKRSEFLELWLHHCLLRHYLMESPLNKSEITQTEEEHQRMLLRMMATQKAVRRRSLDGYLSKRGQEYLPPEVSAGQQHEEQRQAAAAVHYQRDLQNPDNEVGRRLVKATQQAYPPPPKAPPVPPYRVDRHSEDEHPPKL